MTNTYLTIVNMCKKLSDLSEATDRSAIDGRLCDYDLLLCDTRRRFSQAG